MEIFHRNSLEVDIFIYLFNKAYLLLYIVVNPCQHNGITLHTAGGFECLCKKQYKGKHCEGNSRNGFHFHGLKNYEYRVIIFPKRVGAYNFAYFLILFFLKKGIIATLILVWTQEIVWKKKITLYASALKVTKETHVLVWKRLTVVKLKYDV